MIDPRDVDLRHACTRMDSSVQAALEEFWIYSFLVAGKTSSTIAPRLDGMLEDLRKRRSHSNPGVFEAIEEFLQSNIDHTQYIKEWGFGQQKRTLKFLKQTIDMTRSKMDSGIRKYPIQYWSLNEISSIYGVGLKTSRFFLMNTRYNVRVAAIDTHIIKYMKAKGILPEETPSATPTNKKVYQEYEAKFLEVADRYKKDPRDFDQEIWNHYSKNKSEGIACRESIAA